MTIRKDDLLPPPAPRWMMLFNLTRYLASGGFLQITHRYTPPHVAPFLPLLSFSGEVECEKPE